MADKWDVFTAGLRNFIKDYLWLEVILPLAPILTEFLLKAGFPKLGHYNVLEKPLAISAVLVPLISFIKTDPKHGLTRVLYGGAIFWGLALFVMSVIISSPVWPSQNVANTTTIGTSTTNAAATTAPAPSTTKTPGTAPQTSQTQPTAPRQLADLEWCYFLAALGLTFALVVGTFRSLWITTLAPLFGRKPPRPAQPAGS